MANCLVLGADGFIGYHLVDALLNAGHTVRAFDRLKDAVPTNLPTEREGLELYRGDFLSRESLDKSLEGIDYVFHLVSTTNPAVSVKNPLLDVETNLKMTVILLELCVEHKIKRIIFPSTGGAIYGRSLGRPLQEDDPTEPITPYAVCKLAIEGYLRFFKHSHGLDYLALRVSNPYGENQNLVGSQGVIPIFMNLIRQNHPVTVFGDGSMVRDYLYVGDLANAIVRAFDKPAKFNLYNLGSGEGISLLQMIKNIESVTQNKAAIEHRPSRASDVERVLLNVDRFESEFGKVAQTSTDDALSATWSYVQKKDQ